MSHEKQTWLHRGDDLFRRHPLILFVIVLGMAVLTAPLMLAASRITAVLYRDF